MSHKLYSCQSKFLSGLVLKFSIWLFSAIYMIQFAHLKCQIGLKIILIKWLIPCHIDVEYWWQIRFVQLLLLSDLKFSGHIWSQHCKTAFKWAHTLNVKNSQKLHNISLKRSEIYSVRVDLKDTNGMFNSFRKLSDKMDNLLNVCTSQVKLFWST